STILARRVPPPRVAALPELRERLRPHVFRRRREDVLTDLPPIAFYDTPIDAAIDDTMPLPPGIGVLDDDQLIAGLMSHEAALATGRRHLGESKIIASGAFC